MSSTRKRQRTRQSKKASREHLVQAPETQEPYILIPSPPKSPPNVDNRDSCRDGDRDGACSPHLGQRLEPASLMRKATSSRVKKAKASPGDRLAAWNQRRRDSSRWTDGGWGINGNDGLDVDDGGDGSESGCDGGAGLGARLPKPLLACPFYKFNSVRHMSCMRLRLSRVRDVKQHLSRRHRRPIHCPTCGCIFADTKHSDDHIRLRACAKPPGGFNIEGVTESQSVALGRRVNRSLDEASQWFSIWEILFPGSFRPPTPYLSNYVEETIRMVYDYWHRHGQALVTQVAGPSNGDGYSNSVASASWTVLETLLSRFCSSSQDAMSLAACYSLAAEPALSTSPVSEPMLPAKSTGPAEFSPPPRPAHSMQRQPGSSSSSSSSITGHDAFAAGGNTDASAALMFSSGQCTHSVASAAPSQTLSSCSMDTVYESSAYSQLDDPIDFLLLPPVQQSVGPLASADSLDSQWQVHIFAGAWLDTDLGADTGHCDQMPVEQHSTRPPMGRSGDWSFLMDQ